MKRRTNNLRALTLVEMLVALAVLGVGISSVADLIESSRRSGDATDFRVQAAALAQGKLAELGANPALAASAGAAGGEGVLLPAAGPKPFPQDGRYAWRAIVRAEPGQPAGRVGVRVTVDRSAAATAAGAAPAETGSAGRGDKAAVAEAVFLTDRTDRTDAQGGTKQ